MRHGRETARKESDERKTEWTKTPGVCLSAKVETHSVFPRARILLIRWETDLHLCWSQKPVWVRVRTQWQGQLPPWLPHPYKYRKCKCRFAGDIPAGPSPQGCRQEKGEVIRKAR